MYTLALKFVKFPQIFWSISIKTVFSYRVLWMDNLNSIKKIVVTQYATGWNNNNTFGSVTALVFIRYAYIIWLSLVADRGGELNAEHLDSLTSLSTAAAGIAWDCRGTITDYLFYVWQCLQTLRNTT